MGISIKGACFTIGGIAGIWLVNKLTNVCERIIGVISDERKWHAYYKYGGNSAYSVPPGYASHTIPHEDYDYQFVSPEQQREDEKEKSKPNIDASKIIVCAEKLIKKIINEKIENNEVKGVNEKDVVSNVSSMEDIKESSKNKIAELFSENNNVEVATDDEPEDNEGDDEEE